MYDRSVYLSTLSRSLVSPLPIAWLPQLSCWSRTDNIPAEYVLRCVNKGILSSAFFLSLGLCRLTLGSLTQYNIGDKSNAINECPTVFFSVPVMCSGVGTSANMAEPAHGATCGLRETITI